MTSLYRRKYEQTTAHAPTFLWLRVAVPSFWFNMVSFNHFYQTNNPVFTGNVVILTQLILTINLWLKRFSREEMLLELLWKPFVFFFLYNTLNSCFSTFSLSLFSPVNDSHPRKQRYEQVSQPAHIITILCIAI